MVAMVDSKKEVLNVQQIIQIALENTDRNKKYPTQVAYLAILQELSQPNAEIKQIGNTLFEVLKGEGGKGYFKAFNADTAKNFLENSYQFCEWAYKELGMWVLLTEFKDPTIMNIFKIIGKNPPWEGMGYQHFKMNSGLDRVVLFLGPER